MLIKCKQKCLLLDFIYIIYIDVSVSKKRQKSNTRAIKYYLMKTFNLVGPKTPRMSQLNGRN